MTVSLTLTHTLFIAIGNWLLCLTVTLSVKMRKMGCVNLYDLRYCRRWCVPPSMSASWRSRSNDIGKEGHFFRARSP